MKSSLQFRKVTGVKYNRVIYICVFLACLVPRYISTFKLHVGINISFYTIAVAIFWILSTRRILIKKKLEYVFFFLWFGLIVLSVWRAEKIGIWAYYLDWSLTAILLQQIIIKHKNEETFDYIVRSMTDALFIHLLMGLYEVTAHKYLFETGNIGRRLYGHVAIGIFYNLNDYVTFVTTMIPFAIYRFVKSNGLLGKIFSVFLTVSSLYLVAISESRGAILTILAFVCGGIFTFARKKSRNTLIASASVGAFLIICLANLFGIQTALLNLIKSNSINLTENSDIARINLIRNGLYFLGKTYGFGVGAGNLYDWFEQKAIYYIGDLRFIHNWYAEVLATFGVLFFIIYMVFHIKIMYRMSMKKYGTSHLKTAMFLSFVCFSIVSISSSSNVYSEWVWMYLIVISLFSASLEKNNIGRYQIEV